MLRSIDTLRGFSIHASDGELGRVDDFYFDDEQWAVRYMVANTGGWLSGRLVLISPISLQPVDWDDRRVLVNLSREQIEHGPTIEADKPISRQKEAEYFQHYGYQPYWSGTALWGAGIYPGYTGFGGIPAPDLAPGTVDVPTGAPAGQSEQRREATGDPNLRSLREVTGYRIKALNDDIGHVEDFVIEDDTWAIRYMIVDTRNWLPGKKVLVSLKWIDSISWADQAVFVNVLRQQIEDAPEYDHSALLDRDHEARLHRHYDLPTYWE